jgi:NitT/TauT family transport system ATP-binding protein
VTQALAAVRAPSEAVPAVRLREVSRVYGRGPRAVTALDGVSLDVARSEFVCIVGASGCGKSTLLSLVAGLDAPTAGSLDLATDSPALMFQEPALLPWLTARRNVELPLRLRRVPRRERTARADELLSTVHLEGFAERRPHELSGGMRQRVALARALAQTSDLLLMDEPFAAVDAITRDVLHEDLDRVWQTTGVTVLFVTHNVREAARLGDRVVLLTSRPGRVAESWDVRLPRPRLLESPGVAALASEITGRLREEISRHGR